jgi:hypothetical protein
MRTHTTWHRSALIGLMALAALLTASYGSAQTRTSLRQQLLNCSWNWGIFCAEQAEIPYSWYVGHDEPSLLFYSNARGSGNNNIWRVRLPKDPAQIPQQDGKGTTWNFQLHPAFWFGMALCDSQSYPEYTSVCKASTDDNIFNSADPDSRHYIGKHPGTAFMEMQFYPPGWFLTSNSVTQWTAALNIDSLSENGNTGAGNNAACGGINEYVNFAYIQTDGVPLGPPSPLLQNGNTFTVNATTLYMNPGDELLVTEEDTPHGLKITVKDLTTGQSGFMVASAANGFGQILYDPNGTNCDAATHNIPYDFHPMYATSSEQTRVPWAAHTYNIAFSDETGHFEYCTSVDAEGGNCTSSSDKDPPGLDDAFCFDAAYSASFGYIPIGGCIDADVDFDGVPYRRHTWPGTLADTGLDRVLHAEPYIFSSPVFKDDWGNARDYKRVAFEANLPRIESNTNPPCQRHLSNPADPNPGAGCVNPPVGAAFYPIYSTRVTDGRCRWQLGGRYLPFTAQDFGGTSAAEYGSILASLYSGSNGKPQYILENFRQVLDQNPCEALREDHDD